MPVLGEVDAHPAGLSEGEHHEPHPDTSSTRPNAKARSAGSHGRRPAPLQSMAERRDAATPPVAVQPARRDRAEPIAAGVAAADGAASRVSAAPGCTRRSIAAVSPRRRRGRAVPRAAHAHRATRRPAAPSNVVLVTSPGRGDGKSLTAANLAWRWRRNTSGASASSTPTCASPQKHRLFGHRRRPGLSDVLLGPAHARRGAGHARGAPNHGAAGRARSPRIPAELLGTTAMRRTARDAAVAVRPRHHRRAGGDPAGRRRDSGAARRQRRAGGARRGDVESRRFTTRCRASMPAKLLGIVLNEAT